MDYLLLQKEGAASIIVGILKNIYLLANRILEITPQPGP